MTTPTNGPNTEFEGLKSGWMAYLQDPTVRAGLMQFGVGMLQPQQPGQSFAGQVGTSIGEAGQAAGRFAQLSQEQQQLQLAGQREERIATSEEEQTKIAQGQLKVAERGAETAAQREAREATEGQAEISAEQQRIGIAQQQANQLGGYYGALGAAAGQPGTVKSPPGYDAAIKAATEAALFDAGEEKEDGSLSTFEELFIEKKAAIDKAFGVGSVVPAPSAGGGAAPTTAAEPAANPANTPFPGEALAVPGQTYTFKNGVVGKYVSPGQIEVISVPGAASMGTQ